MLSKTSKLKPSSVDRGGENLVKEIQAMIISQELQRENKAKMAKVNGNHPAHRFLSDPALNERKTIDKRFQRKQYSSLAVDLYKSKLSNNPIRQQDLNTMASISQSTANNLAALDQENMPLIAQTINTNSRHPSKGKNADKHVKRYTGDNFVDSRKAVPTFDKMLTGLNPMTVANKQTF